MNKFFGKLREFLTRIIIGIFFAFSIFLTIYMFPSERKFKYEFTKGLPWKHEDYYAEFDFPVYKTDEMIAAEQDSLLSHFQPYFIRYDSVARVNTDSLQSKVENEWSEFAKEKKEAVNLSSRQVRELKALGKELKPMVVSLLERVYADGVIETHEEFQKARKNNTDILVFSEDVASEKDVETLYTEKGAYKYITSALTSFSDTYGTKFGNIKNDFFNKLDINHYLEPNIIYDEETSLKARKQILENISLTTGLIQKGEKIISEGELIDAEKVQILESAEKEFENQTGGNLSWVFFGRILLVLIIFLCLYLYLRNFQAHILRSSKKTIFILFIMTMTVALTSLTARFDFVNIYLIPVIILPILIRTFFDGHIAIFVHILTILLIGFFVGNAFEYGFLNFSAGIIAVFSLTASNSRSKLLLTSLWVVLTYALVYLGFAFIHEGSLENMQYTNFVWFAVNGILLLVSYPLIYLFEKTFGFISDATLLELADTNQPLLRRMAEMAPGTFQHSLQVANLAEEATIKIGGNPLLVRAGALYHDIGKMKSPEFFTENQTPGMNPHDDLSFEESAKIIISHVSVGVEMAKKHNLPNQLIDFIRTHHGTSTVQYFYRSYLKKFPGENVDIKKFKYPGPRPFSKETAVLMMADSVEAASRSLKEMTEKTIGDLVDNIINYQVMEEQFDDANITFKDISTIKKVFKNKLKNIYHARIAYPDAPKKENAKYANTNE